jgi:hypothetical protein
MSPETYPPLATLLRSTLHLVKYYRAPDAPHRELDELTTVLQQTIAAMEAREAMKQTGLPPGFPGSH